MDVAVALGFLPQICLQQSVARVEEQKKKDEEKAHQKELQEKRQAAAIAKVCPSQRRPRGTGAVHFAAGFAPPPHPPRSAQRDSPFVWGPQSPVAAAGPRHSRTKAQRTSRESVRNAQYAGGKARASQARRWAVHPAHICTGNRRRGGHITAHAQGHPDPLKPKQDAGAERQGATSAFVQQ